MTDITPPRPVTTPNPNTLANIGRLLIAGTQFVPGIGSIAALATDVFIGGTNPAPNNLANQINPLINQFINATTPQARQQATTQLQELTNQNPRNVRLTLAQRQQLANSIQQLSTQQVATVGRLLANPNNSPLQQAEHQSHILEIEYMATLAQYFLRLSLPQQQRQSP